MLKILRRITPKRHYYTVKSTVTKEPDLKISICRAIRSKIKATGPITVADFMRETLTSPLGGYYMTRDVFGAQGDFVTSPELSQMFGEMVAVWFLNEWSKIGSPKPFQIVELGPGRGTLSDDILRVFEHFNCLKGASLHLIEASMVLSDIQAKRLCLQNGVVPDGDSVVYREGIAHQGIPVKWYRNFEEIPDVFSLVVANEFFDALPIHKLQKTERGYREILIDIEPSDETTFRYVIANCATPATKLFENRQKVTTKDHVEFSPESLILAKSIATKVTEHGGLCLIADYGHVGEKTDTFRAFKQHKLHDPLKEPGTADLTADVDFAALKHVIITIKYNYNYHLNSCR